jgi:hypothetical protein
MNARHLIVAAMLAAFAVLTVATLPAMAQTPDARKRPDHPVHVQPRPPMPHVTGHVPPPVHHPQPVSAPGMHRQHGDWGPQHYRYPEHYRYPGAVVFVQPGYVYPQGIGDTALIRIGNPALNGATVAYSLDGQLFYLAPGNMQWLNRPCVITYDAGDGGLRRAVLTRGNYVFEWDPYSGWILRRV